MLSNLKNEIDLIQRHVRILKLVVENQPIGIIKLSELCGMPQHKVRYSLRVLEHKGVIRPSSQGAVSTENAKEFMKQLPTELKFMSRQMKELAENL